MSNTLAVATATEALRLFIERNLAPDTGLPASVFAQKPPVEAPTDPTVTIFCYQISPNAALRSRDAPTRAADGTPLRKPQAAIDLHYLISFYGNETELVPQRMLGSVVRSLYESPVLTRADLDAAAARPYLLGSDLPAAPDRVRFTPTNVDIDELYKLWSMLSQTPFALSLTYLASVVVIDGRTGGAPGPPVLARTVRAVAGRRPFIARVIGQPPEGDPAEGPVPPGHKLLLDGRDLAADGIWARVGDLDVAIPAGGARGDRLEVPLPDSFAAGLHPVRVLHDVVTGPATRLVKVMESNAVVLVRPPRITAATYGAGAVELTLAPPVGATQRVRLLLDDVASGGGHQIDAPHPLPHRADERLVEIPVPDVPAGRYLVRVQVDGAMSALQLTDGSFSGPTVEVGP